MASRQRAATNRTIDITLTVVLLIGHAALAFFSALWVGLSVMGLDPCGYVECGSERWAGVGVKVAFVGGFILVLADLFVSSWRLANRTTAWFVPLLFCLAQVGLALIGLALVSLAGPI